MTLDDAIAEARALQFEADNDWPYGYDREQFAARTLPMLRAFDAYLATIPGIRAQLAARDEAGRRILAILIRATVAEDPDEWLTDALAFIDTAPPTWKTLIEVNGEPGVGPFTEA